MSVDDALASESSGDLVRAAELYEAAISDGDRTLPTLLRLALLYWQLSDPGVSAANHLNTEFVATSEARMNELFALAQNLYPKSTTARFWPMYIRWADLGEPFDVHQCEALLGEDPTEPTPALYIAMATAGMARRAEAEQLLLSLEGQDDTRARYVRSVLNRLFERIDSKV